MKLINLVPSGILDAIALINPQSGIIPNYTLTDTARRRTVVRAICSPNIITKLQNLNSIKTTVIGNNSLQFNAL